jgi:hypothetical protein
MTTTKKLNPRTRHPRVRKGRKTHRGGITFQDVRENFGHATRSATKSVRDTYHGLSQRARSVYDAISRRFRRRPPATNGETSQETESLLNTPIDNPLTNLSDDQKYLYNFFKCHKSSMFTRYTYREACSSKNKGSKYWLVKESGISIDWDKLSELINKQLNILLRQITLIVRMKVHYIQLVYSKIYVVTYGPPSFRQEIEEETVDGKPPPTTDDRVVVPLSQYRKKYLTKMIEEIYDDLYPQVQKEMEEKRQERRRQRKSAYELRRKENKTKQLNTSRQQGTPTHSPFRSFFSTIQDNGLRNDIPLDVVEESNTVQQGTPISPSESTPPPPPPPSRTEEKQPSGLVTVPTSFDNDKMEQNVYFVSSDEFFQKTRIKFTKIKEVTNYNKTSNTYDLKIDIIHLETPEKSTIFCLSSGTNYIYVTPQSVDGNLYIIDFKGKGFTKELRTEVINSPPPRYEILNAIKAEYVYVPMKFNEKKIPIPEEVHAEVLRLNDIINRTGCTGFRLAFDYGYNFPGERVRLNSYNQTPCVLMLCLFHGNTCVSSIEIYRPEPHLVAISSFSNPEVEKVGLNKLLRAATILIAPKLSPSIQFLTSLAINPVSAHLLINKLNGNKDEVMRRPVPFQTFKRQIEEKGRIHIKIDMLDPVTIQQAQQLMSQVLQSPGFKAKCNEKVER